MPQLTESYTPIIHYLSNDDSVASIVGDALDTTQPIGLVGLHTCGDLACTVLRQFVQEPVIIQSVCLVDCCYHHITEERDVTGISHFILFMYINKHFRCLCALLVFVIIISLRKGMSQVDHIILFMYINKHFRCFINPSLSLSLSKIILACKLQMQVCKYNSSKDQIFSCT